MKKHILFFLFFCCLYAGIVSKSDSEENNTKEDKPPAESQPIIPPTGTLPPSALSITLVSLKNVLMFVSLFVVYFNTLSVCPFECSVTLIVYVIA